MGILEAINQFVWGIPAICLILGAGGYLTIRTNLAQLRLLPNGLKVFAKQMLQSDSNNKDVTPYQAFCTALGATVGTGNIVGVAGAISIGGPGAVFWMWISASFGMILKYTEVLLSVHYQNMDPDHSVSAGPMYIIKKGMDNKWRIMAYLYALMGMIASFGVGNSVQINAVITTVKNTILAFGGPISQGIVLILGILLAVFVGFMLAGDVKRITTVAEFLVPIVSSAYILLCLGVLVSCWREIDDVVIGILRGAFSPQAVTGGAVGSILQTMRIGTARGVFTNEAGLGTAGIAHGCAKVEHPAKQGVLGIIEVFIDTIVICTLTAFVILCCGLPIDYGADLGAELTTNAFICVYGKWVVIPLSGIIICLAIATINGWGLYGLKCSQFLVGNQNLKMFVICQCIAAFLGAIAETPKIWLLAEVVNGLMMVPNIMVLIHRASVAVNLTREYENDLRKG